MKAVKLLVEPYNFSVILDCRIHKTVNQHFAAEISGYTEESTETIMKHVNQSSQFIVYMEDENGIRKSIFRGSVEQLSIQTEGKLKTLSIASASHTCLLDEEVHSRVFQNPNQTYCDLARYIVEKNQNTVSIYTRGREQKTQGLVLQYEESDWSFLKRMAGQAQTVLVPDCTNNKASFFFGIPSRGEKVFIQSDEVKMVICSENKKSILMYQFESRECWELCKPVEMDGIHLLIYDIRSAWISGELVHHYTLRREADFAIAEPYNKEIIGLAIEGIVKHVNEREVKVSLECEDASQEAKKIWLSFATIYSSPDGSSWYFMPEIGDKVRVCFPTEKEHQAYVINAIHVEEGQGKRNDPEEKFIRTIHNKEIRFSQDQIRITNYKGMSIVIDDQQGIMIESKKKISLESGESISILSGGQIRTEAEGGILLKQNENSIVIQDGVRANGLKVQFR